MKGVSTIIPTVTDSYEHGPLLLEHMWGLVGHLFVMNSLVMGLLLFVGAACVADHDG